MSIIYWMGVKLYGLLLRLISPFHAKARKWVAGRRDLFAEIARAVDPNDRCVWFHFASLGEFEQGRPVIERLRTERPDKKILLTFYSPSGYEIRKDTPLADHVFYLPEDIPNNARRFLALVNPELAIFTKYEFWPFFFRELHGRAIPLYIISVIFRADQVFFKWYGGFFREVLHKVTHFYTQDTDSVRLLEGIGLRNATVAGDTRFDRVLALAGNRQDIPMAAAFVSGSKVLVAGSTWPADEVLLADTQSEMKGWSIIIAPHEVSEHRIAEIERLFPYSLRYSSCLSDSIPSSAAEQPASVLIIDNIGLLSSLYAYGDLAYIGGGFGAGIHNTLEAAAYGLPVIFGPKYHKFAEATGLITVQAARSVSQQQEFLAAFRLWEDDQQRETAGRRASEYVHAHAGATSTILVSILARYSLPPDYG